MKIQVYVNDVLEDLDLDKPGCFKDYNFVGSKNGLAQLERVRDE